MIWVAMEGCGSIKHMITPVFLRLPVQSSAIEAPDTQTHMCTHTLQYNSINNINNINAVGTGMQA